LLTYDDSRFASVCSALRKAFLRRLLRKTGADAKHTVFLINDMQLAANERFLEDINGLLNSAQVSNLWPPEELAEALEVARLEAKKNKKNLDDQQQLLNYFVQQCRANLHVVLCMSPIGNSFRERLRMFPSLISQSHARIKTLFACFLLTPAHMVVCCCLFLLQTAPL
jgi:hypothetical protein